MTALAPMPPCTCPNGDPCYPTSTGHQIGCPRAPWTGDCIRRIEHADRLDREHAEIDRLQELGDLEREEGRRPTRRPNAMQGERRRRATATPIHRPATRDDIR